MIGFFFMVYTNHIWNSVIYHYMFTSLQKSIRIQVKLFLVTVLLSTLDLVVPGNQESQSESLYRPIV